MLTLALLSIHAPLTKKQLVEFDRGKLRVNLHDFIFRGSFKWAKFVDQLSQQLQAHASQASFVDAPPPESFVAVQFTCPHGHLRQATQPLFSPANPSKVVWCPSCKCSHGGRKWQCPCNRSWSQCPIHLAQIPIGVAKRRAVADTTNEAMDSNQANKKLRQLDGQVFKTHLVFRPGPALTAKLGTFRAAEG